MIWILMAGLAVLVTETAVKGVMNSDLQVAFFANSQGDLGKSLSTTLSSEKLVDFEALGRRLGIDLRYRLAGLDFPAAIWQSHNDFGYPYLLGRHNALAASKVVPRVFWPDKPIEDPEALISESFDLLLPDQLSTPLPSALADGGPLGAVAIFFALGSIMAVLQALIWKSEVGFFLYLASFAYLLNYEEYAFAYPAVWLRFVVITAIISKAFLLIVGRAKRSYCISSRSTAQPRAAIS
jgi:hypothetical protein